MNGSVLSLFVFMLCKCIDPSTARTKKVSPPFSKMQLMECAVLDPKEYDKRVDEGLCPPVQQSKKKKVLKSHLPKSVLKRYKKYQRKQKKKAKKAKPKKALSGKTKKIILKAVFLGKQAVYKMTLGAANYDFELIAGLFLIMECPGIDKRRKEKIDWYIDGVRVERSSPLEWRMRINPANQLEIWPLLVNSDDGRYECYINNEPKGAVSLHVITVTEGLIKGVFNYFVAVLFSLPIVVFAILFRLSHPQREAILMEDPVVEFYERILDLKTTQMKGHIAKSVYKDKFEEKRAEVTTMMTKYNCTPDGKRLRNNRDTVMTILNMAEANNARNQLENVIVK